jgi:hypothetical protein
MAIALAALGFALASTAQGLIDTSDGLVHGCYYTVATPNARLGTLRIVNPNDTCPAGQQAPITWWSEGTRGAQGQVGPVGPSVAGHRGPQGPTGRRGFAGPPGYPARSRRPDVRVRAFTVASPPQEPYKTLGRRDDTLRVPCHSDEEPVSAGVTVPGIDHDHIAPFVTASYPDPQRHEWVVTIRAEGAAGYQYPGMRVQVSCWPGYPSKPRVDQRFTRFRRP